jgi:hypothetical protein
MILVRNHLHPPDALAQRRLTARPAGSGLLEWKSTGPFNNGYPLRTFSVASVVLGPLLLSKAGYFRNSLNLLLMKMFLRSLA